MEPIFGIDLGTTYSCIAYVNEDGKPEVIKNAEDESTTPSVIYFDSETEYTVGSAAKDNEISDPDNGVSFIKREMGKKDYRRTIRGESYSPQELSSRILKKLITDATNTLMDQGVIQDDNFPKKAVITCPAYFGMEEKNATKEAGELAGIEVLDIINEPTAAAISYGQKNAGKGEKRYLVYDLGGGTFDVTIMDIKPAADEIRVDVVCTGGDAMLGGKDWDELTVQHLMQKWQEEKDSPEEIIDNPETRSNMYAAAEKAKKFLTGHSEAKVNFVHEGDAFRTTISKEEFDQYTADKLQLTIQMTNACIEEMKKKDEKPIDEILLVGGSCYMPQVQSKLEENYQLPVSRWDPNQAVALGAAIYAQNKNAYQIILEDIAKQTGKTTEEVQREVNETGGDVTAAAKNAGVDISAKAVGGNLMSVVTHDVSSRTYGLRVMDGYTNEPFINNLIFQNDTLPAKIEETYATHSDNQEGADLQLFESIEKGDIRDPEVVRTKAPVAVFHMKFQRGVPRGTDLHVVMTLNNSGLLSIDAEEMLYHSKLHCEQEVTGGLSEAEKKAAHARSEKATLV